MSISESRLMSIVAIVILASMLAVAALMLPPCSKSFTQDLTWDLELLRSEQESNQSMLHLIDSIFEWEKVADDFSMHNDWVARQARANMRLIELSISILDYQNQLDKCNQKGD